MKTKNNNTTNKLVYWALAILALVCLALAPAAQALLPSPTPDGGYPNFNTAEGTGALFQGSGAWNTAVGYQALTNHGSGGSYNTAIGAKALWDDFSGRSNTAVGYAALYEGGTANTATGVFALRGAPQDFGGNGSYNTADGLKALYHNTGGSRNTASGAFALYGNDNNFNTGSGSDNTAIGYAALGDNSTGDWNTAVGAFALDLNNTGANNTAIGYSALQNNTNGVNNVALGFQAGQNLTTGHGNVCIGAGVLGIVGESQTTRIRNIYPSVASARAVYVNADNKIGTLSSSRRYKEEIKPMDKASEALFALKPVTFRYKKDVDAAQALSFGLIAEDVAEISPDLITRDEDGKPQTVRYEAVNAMLLNEFLKEHRTVQELEATVARQEATISQQKKDFQAIATQQQEEIEALTASLKEQASQIQKVSAELELQKASAQTVVNN